MFMDIGADAQQAPHAGRLNSFPEDPIWIGKPRQVNGPTLCWLEPIRRLLASWPQYRLIELL
jgi:hypothetical protein